jgi:hypothetical protein
MTPEQPQSNPPPPPVLHYGPPAPAAGPSGLPMRLRGWIAFVVILAALLYLLLKGLLSRSW